MDPNKQVVHELNGPTKEQTHKLALASLIVSIGAVVLLSLPAGIVATVLAVKAKKRGHETPMPTIAIALSALAMAVSLFVTVFALSFYVNEIMPTLYPDLFEEEVTTEQVLTDEEIYDFIRLDDGTYAVSVAEGVTLTGICAVPAEHNGIPVTAIAENGFCGQALLNQLILPDSIRVVGEGAFECCDRVYSLTLGNELTSIGPRAFAGCASLEELKIPDGVTVIGAGAFRGCATIKSLTVPEGVTRIESDTFRDCSALTKIQIPNGITHVGPRAFSGCAQLTKLALPDTVTELGAYALEGCAKLTEFHIPEGVTVLAEGVFYGCASVKKIQIHEGITYVSPRVFSECFLLREVTVPLSVAVIEKGAFDGCSNLAALRYAGTQEEWERIRTPDEWPSTLLSVSCADGMIRLSK